MYPLAEQLVIAVAVGEPDGLVLQCINASVEKYTLVVKVVVEALRRRVIAINA